MKSSKTKFMSLSVVLASAFVFGCKSKHSSDNIPTSEIRERITVIVKEDASAVQFNIELTRRPGSLREVDVVLAGNDRLFVVDSLGEIEALAVTDGLYTAAREGFVGSEAKIELRRDAEESALNTVVTIPGFMNLIEPSSILQLGIDDQLTVSWSTTGSVSADQSTVPDANSVVVMDALDCMNSSDEEIFSYQSDSTNKAGDFVGKRLEDGANADSTMITFDLNEITLNEEFLSTEIKSQIDHCIVSISAGYLDADGKIVPNIGLGSINLDPLLDTRLADTGDIHYLTRSQNIRVEFK